MLTRWSRRLLISLWTIGCNRIILMGRCPCIMCFKLDSNNPTMQTDSSKWVLRIRLPLILKTSDEFYQCFHGHRQLQIRSLSDRETIQKQSGEGFDIIHEMEAFALHCTNRSQWTGAYDRSRLVSVTSHNRTIPRGVECRACLVNVSFLTQVC